MERSKKTPEQNTAKVEKEMALIDKSVQGLKRFEIDRPHGTPDAVDAAVGTIKIRFATHPEWKPKGTVILLFGSLQYHDLITLI